MGLVQRVARIISANLNDLVDRCEDPDKMLRQAVRDLEVCLEESLDGAARLVAAERLLRREEALEEKQAEGCRRRAEDALQSGNVEAARTALRSREERRAAAGRIRAEAEATQAATRSLKRQVEEMRTKLAEARRALGTLSARKRAAAARRRLLPRLPGGGEAALARFERMRERIEAAEAEADARQGLEEDGRSADPEVDRRVEEELEALRRGLAG